MLTGFDPATSAVGDFVQLVANGSDTVVLVDSDGAANGANFVALATLQGVATMPNLLDDLLANQNLVLA